MNDIEFLKAFNDRIDENIRINGLQIDPKVFQMNISEKEKYFSDIFMNTLISKEYAIGLTNDIIDMKKYDHIHIYYNKIQSDLNTIVDMIVSNVEKYNLDYNAFQDELHKVTYDQHLNLWDTEYVTDVGPRVATKLIKKRHNIFRILGMLNIDNVKHYNIKNNFLDVLKGLYYYYNVKPEVISYLMSNTLIRIPDDYKLGLKAAVTEKRQLIIKDGFNEEEIKKILLHEHYHTRYHHIQRYDIVEHVYPVYGNFFNHNWTYAIESVVNTYIRLGQESEGKFTVYENFKNRRSIRVWKLPTNMEKRRRTIEEMSKNSLKICPAKMVLNRF